jgi:hypothetical protein
MALQIIADCSGLTAYEAYVRPEVFYRAGSTTEEGKPFNSVIKVYANKAQSEPGGKGAFRDFNCAFVQASGQTIEAACYAALKELPEMAGATDV